MSEIQNALKAPEAEKVKIVDVLLILGQGVKPQLRQGAKDSRHVVIGSTYDAQGLRAKAVAAKELIAHGFVKDLVIASGSNTAGEQNIKEALAGQQADVETARVAIREAKGLDATVTREAINQELVRMIQAIARPIKQQELLGRPFDESEAALVETATEAGLTIDLMERVVVKPSAAFGSLNPKKVIEPVARNSTQNIIYTINELDRRAGKMWDGSIAVLTSNNGHMQRAEGILLAYGIDESKIVLLSVEDVLGNYGYSNKYLEGLRTINTKEETLRGQAKWAEGVRRMPEYVLQEVRLFENDDRLRSVVGALGRWYQRVGIDIFEKYPQLKNYAEMDPGELRDALKNIKRELPPDSWGNEIDVDEWRRKVDESARKTTEFLSQK